jgi:hypothetical protein
MQKVKTGSRHTYRFKDKMHHPDYHERLRERNGHICEVIKWVGSYDTEEYKYRGYEVAFLMDNGILETQHFWVGYEELITTTVSVPIEGRLNGYGLGI